MSLQEQQDAIRHYAARQGLRIIRSFEEQETAAKRGRPVFSEMLRLLKRGVAHGVIIHKIDRGARNLKDWADLAELMDIGVEVYFVNESLDLNTRGGRLSADIQAVVAADYIRNLREETKKGFYGRLKQGLYPIRAPIGYLDCGGGKTKAPDSKMAHLVREAFELYAAGNVSLPRLVEEMYRRGLRNKAGAKVSLNGISTMLNNPFYTGLIRIKKTGDSFAGAHEPLVSTQLFNAVQNVLKGKVVPRTRHHEFAFSRMIKCALCSNTVMAETHKSHVYYRCHTRCCPMKTVREEAIDNAVSEAFASLRFADDEIAYIKEWFVWTRMNNKERIEERLKAYHLEKGKIRDRIARLTDAYLDGVVEKEAYNERRAHMIVEENEVKRCISNIENGDNQTLKLLEEYLELVQSASNLYKVAIPSEKRTLAKKLTSNLHISPEKLDITLRNAAKLIANRSLVLEGSPCRGVPRTWNAILETLVKQFESEDAELPLAA